MPHPPSRHRRATTLTEMLVVLGIILVVMSIVISGAVSMRKAARRTLCLTHLRDIGIAVSNYSSRYDGWVPLASWADLGVDRSGASESALSPRSFGHLSGDSAQLYGPGAGPCPPIRDALQPFQKTKEPIWRCPSQREDRGPEPVLFTTGYIDDEHRGWRPGYRYMCTLDFAPLIKSRQADKQTLGILNAEALLVRNIAGLKYNRIRTVDKADSTRIVLAYDLSGTYHGKESSELIDLGPGGAGHYSANFLYLDGHAEVRDYRDSASLLKLFHGPVRQKWYGSDFESDYATAFVGGNP